MSGIAPPKKANAERVDKPCEVVPDFSLCNASNATNKTLQKSLLLSQAVPKEFNCVPAKLGWHYLGP